MGHRFGILQVFQHDSLVMRLVIFKIVEPWLVVLRVEGFDDAVVFGDESAGTGAGFVEGFVGFDFVLESVDFEFVGFWVAFIVELVVLVSLIGGIL